MIVLITGASHIGKTVLAQKLLEKHKYPLLLIKRHWQAAAQALLR